MSQTSFKNAMRKIRAVIYHIGMFEQSFPKILKGTREYTRSHLVILRECLPDLRGLIRYTANTLPAMAQIMGLADKSTTGLVRASEILRNVRKATEDAVNEIFKVLDRVDPLLEQVANAEIGNEATRQTLEDVRTQLMQILSVLQFQDITSQQIEATNALLADLGNGFATLMEELGEQVAGLPQIKVMAGTFDPNARFDMHRAGEDQQAIDQLIEGDISISSTEFSSKQDPETPGCSDKSKGEEESTQQASETIADDTEPMGQDAIDALLKG